MDKRNLKRNYRKACKVLGFDVKGYIERMKKYQDLDDYKRTLRDPIKDNDELYTAFSEAFRIYHFEPEEFQKIFE